MGNFNDLKVIQFILHDSTGNNACLPHSQNDLEIKVKQFIRIVGVGESEQLFI